MKNNKRFPYTGILAAITFLFLGLGVNSVQAAATNSSTSQVLQFKEATTASHAFDKGKKKKKKKKKKSLHGCPAF